jgi:hypothetical protein
MAGHSGAALTLSGFMKNKAQIRALPRALPRHLSLPSAGCVPPALPRRAQLSATGRVPRGIWGGTEY